MNGHRPVNRRTRVARRKGRRGDRGSSLVEAVVAMGLMSVAVVAVVQLVSLSVGLHADAGEASRAVWHAADVLRSLEQHGGEGNLGGSLEGDAPGFFDQPEPGIVRRWVVAAGPVAGTRAVAVCVFNQRARRAGRTAEVSSIVGVEPEP